MKSMKCESRIEDTISFLYSTTMLCSNGDFAIDLLKQSCGNGIINQKIEEGFTLYPEDALNISSCMWRGCLKKVGRMF